MNSQQELLDAINTISQSKDRSCDTPATVLRVEGETVWVHIDGGADETPVLKTINCEQGETVQVRISNGNAFLVGNASAPPTDDKTAKVAHFVAEQAEIEAANAQNKAIEAQATAEAAQAAVAQSLTTYETWYLLSATTPTQPTEDSHTGWSTTEPAWSSSSTDTLYYSIRTVKGDGTATWSAVGTVQSYADLVILKNAIISTVQNDYVAQGSSGVTSLSSTMLQNVNGVNIYNNTLAVGDSYAHIDENSFDIRQATTAGTIDDANDTVLATFGANETVIGRTDVQGGKHIKLKPNSLEILENIGGNLESGWIFDAYTISYELSDNSQDYFAMLYEHGIDFSHTIGQSDSIDAVYEYDVAQLSKNVSGVSSVTRIEAGCIKMTGNVQDFSGNNKTPTILTSTTISAATTSYTFSDASITADSTIEVFDEIDGFEYTTCSASAGSCTITFPAQSTSHKIKLHVY